MNTPIDPSTIELLEDAFLTYHNSTFIPDDPIQIPHLFSKKQDIEIMGFFAAVLAWGQRKTIINKCNDLVELFDGAPYDFIIQHEESDLKRFLGFKHRTFNATDLLYFIAFLKYHYSHSDSLEYAFKIDTKNDDIPVKGALMCFHDYFCSLDFFPLRTRKHVATPARNSACKRLNMFLRWMVRKDNKGIDFGIWNTIHARELLCPLDVHVARVARQLGLITRKQHDFKTVLELTDNLKQIDAEDPVRFDFALFGLGVHDGLS